MKHFISKALFVTAIATISIQANNDIESITLDAEVNKLENILRIHEGVISGLMDDKAEKKDLSELKDKIFKIEKDIKALYLEIRTLKEQKVEKSELQYDSKFDKKFKEYLNKRKANSK